MTFSRRTEWQRKLNRLSEVLEQRRASGRPVIDLTESNPTACGIEYPESEIMAALSQQGAFAYRPDPRGLLSARQSVSSYYARQGIAVDPGSIILTSGTSEAYSMIFRLLCNPGDEVLIPEPSYPMFEFLARLNDVGTVPYAIRYDGSWHVDMETLRGAISPSTRAIILIHPHNPTGMFLTPGVRDAVVQLAMQHGIALIVDEVFLDYRLGGASERCGSFAAASGPLIFTLNGLSKTAGLPQMKIGWVCVGGNPEETREALDRLEIISDTFLSVNTPAQAALPQWFESCEAVRKRISGRIATNLAALAGAPSAGSGCTLCRPEGGWNAVLRIPRTRTDEEWAVGLLEKEGVYLYPGYFFDFAEDGYLVVSLLVEPAAFRTGVEKALRYIESGAS